MGVFARMLIELADAGRDDSLVTLPPECPRS
jgi:hypothetical protein